MSTKPFSPAALHPPRLRCHSSTVMRKRSGLRRQFSPTASAAPEKSPSSRQAIMRWWSLTESAANWGPNHLRAKEADPCSGVPQRTHE